VLALPAAANDDSSARVALNLINSTTGCTGDRSDASSYGSTNRTADNGTSRGANGGTRGLLRRRTSHKPKARE
jgi:hypothetical protein